MDKKRIKEHYDNEVKQYSNSAKCTMRDLFTRNLEVLKLEEVIREITAKNDTLEILEVGCGNGHTISKLIDTIIGKFTGIDSNKNMIRLALKRKLKNVNFSVGDILKPKLKPCKFDIVFSERCLINLPNWNLQCKALQQIYKLLRHRGHYIMLEAFDDGLNELNLARKALGLEKIQPAWHNYYFNKKRLENYIKGKFCGLNTKTPKKIFYDNFLSSYYFGSRVLYPSLIDEKSNIIYNNKFVKYFSLIPSIGNYSPIQLCILQKI